MTARDRDQLAGELAEYDERLQEAARLLGTRGGLARSPRKAQASRENAAKGRLARQAVKTAREGKDNG